MQKLITTAKAAVNKAAVTGTALALTAGGAMAEAVDVTATVTDIKAQIASVALVGGAVLSVFAAVKALKWIRSAMS